MIEIRLEIPCTPPSANHYKKPRIVTPRHAKPFLQWYLTDEAEAWHQAVSVVAAGRRIVATAFEVSFIVYMRSRRLIDTDNFSKCVLDSLTHAGVIADDKYVDDFHGHRRFDPANPRTVIIVKAENGQVIA